MPMTTDADLATLASVTRHLSTTLAAIENQHWARPTPCEEWDLRALVDHVTGGNWFTAGILDGATADAALSDATGRFGSASPTVVSAIQAAVSQLDAFQRPQALTRTWDHIAGHLSGRDILRLRLHDLIVHSWDIDRTLSATARLPLDLANWAMSELAQSGSRSATHFHLVDIDVPHEGASPDIAYLHAFGRTDWGSAPDHRR